MNKPQIQFIQFTREEFKDFIYESVKEQLQEFSSKFNANSTEETKDKILDIKGASILLNLTVPTIYSKVSKGELPFMKRSKRLYFSTMELMQYLKQGRKKSNFEIEQEAEADLLINNKGLNNGR